MNIQINSFLPSYPCQDANQYLQIVGAQIDIDVSHCILLSSTGVITAKPPG